MNLTDPPAQLLIRAEFEQCLAQQRAAYLADPNPSHAQRVSDLKTLARMLKENHDALVAAICSDYGIARNSKPCSPSSSPCSTASATPSSSSSAG